MKQAYRLLVVFERSSRNDALLALYRT